MTDNLAARLLPAIEQAERAARDAQAESPTPWIRGNIYSVPHEDTPGESQIYDAHRNVVIHDEGVPGPAVAAFIVDQQPSMTLRRCAADRRTVERHSEAAVRQFDGFHYRFWCRSCHNEMPCPDLLDRAAAYNITTEETT